jgi:hypothetical protein
MLPCCHVPEDLCGCCGLARWCGVVWCGPRQVYQYYSALGSDDADDALTLSLEQLWELCKDCHLLDRRVTVASVNRMLQQLRARHTDAVFAAFVARTKKGCVLPGMPRAAVRMFGGGGTAVGRGGSGSYGLLHRLVAPPAPTGGTARTVDAAAANASFNARVWSRVVPRHGCVCVCFLVRVCCSASESKGEDGHADARDPESKTGEEVSSSLGPCLSLHRA